MVKVEYMQSESGYCVIFMPYSNAPKDECMLLSVHKEERHAERYAQSFNATLQSAFVRYMLEANR